MARSRPRTSGRPALKRVHRLVAGLVFVGGALVDLLAGGPVDLGVFELVVAICIAVVVIDAESSRRSPQG